MTFRSEHFRGYQIRQKQRWVTLWSVTHSENRLQGSVVRRIGCGRRRGPGDGQEESLVFTWMISHQTIHFYTFLGYLLEHLLEHPPFRSMISHCGIIQSSIYGGDFSASHGPPESCAFVWHKVLFANGSTGKRHCSQRCLMCCKKQLYIAMIAHHW